MTHRLQNETIFLNLRVKDRSSDNITFHISEALNVILPAQLLIPNYLQSIICFSGWIFLIIGSFYRFVVYKHLFQEYKKKNLSPINVLIIFSCWINHFSVLIALIYETLVVYYGENLESITGYEFCVFARYTFGFDMLYSFFGGLGIAIYRILLIKRNQWVKYGFGEENLLLLVLLSGVGLAMGFVSTAMIADDFNVANTKCIIVPGTKLLEILGNYQKSMEYFPLYLHVNELRRYIALTLIFVTLVELTIYIYFFRHIYKNDNSESLLKALGPKIIKARNKTNALTFFSHFCSFIFQIAFMLLMLIASFNTPDKSYAYILASFLKKMSFAIMAIVEVVTSRKNLKATMF